MQENFKDSDITVEDNQKSAVFKESITILKDLRENRNFKELNLCIIPVYLEGEKKSQYFDMLVDTGAELTMVSEYIAKVLDIEPTNNSTKGRGVSGRTKYKNGIVKNIEIRHINSETKQSYQISLESSVVVIGRLTGKFKDYNIQGLLGAEALQQICLKIDYLNKYIEFSQMKNK